MKNRNFYYYILFVLIVFGAFASMAQNDYGMMVLGLAAVAFAVVFILEWVIPDKEHPVTANMRIELTGLILLSILFACRLFYIQFPGTILLFAAASTLLTVFYLRRMIKVVPETRKQSAGLVRAVSLYYGAVILYSLSMVVVSFSSGLVLILGEAATVVVILFLLVGFTSGSFLVEGNKVTVFQYVFGLRDRSLLVCSFFLMFSLYIGLNRLGVLPSLYSDEMPQAYYGLVNEAETGDEEPVEGVYKHQRFKQAYETLVKRHRTNP